MTEEKQFTVEELGELVACSGCERPTYDASLLKESGKLPEGLTVGNKRMTVLVHGVLLVVCANCRYTLYGRF